MGVPLLDLTGQFKTMRDEIIKTMVEICDSQRFILGPAVEKFEKSLAAYCGTGFAVGVTSGSDALIIALMAELHKSLDCRCGWSAPDFPLRKKRG